MLHRIECAFRMPLAPAADALRCDRELWVFLPLLMGGARPLRQRYSALQFKELADRSLAAAHRCHSL